MHAVFPGGGGAVSASSGGGAPPRTATARPEEMRPRLRGWSHLAAAPIWLVLTAVLLAIAAGNAGRQVALLVYGAASVVLFAVSGAYHAGRWSPGVRRLLRRLDHGNIFVLVAATYTPIVLTLLDGAWRVSLLSAVWGVALVGFGVEVSTLAVPRSLLALWYLALGWVSLIAMPLIATVVGAGGLTLLLVAGALYTTGAVFYALRRPNPLPRWFGYHELFHVLVIAANALFFAFMVSYVARRA